ncbi:MAG: hypothetical protein ACYDAZ_06650 [Thermoplasmataceae archaeon]
MRFSRKVSVGSSFPVAATDIITYVAEYSGILFGIMEVQDRILEFPDRDHLLWVHGYTVVSISKTLISAPTPDAAL